MPAAALDTVLRRDRLVVLASLVALCLLAWFYLFHLSAEMASMDMAADTTMDMPGMEGMADRPAAASGGAATQTSALTDFVLLALMWSVMMVGMMLPSAAPTILLFSALERKRAGGRIGGRVALFVAGYFLAWSAFSVSAAGAQTVLARMALLSPGMAVTSAILGGAVFVLAGLYEFTPLKKTCLTHCRSPLDWIPRHMRPGRIGALRMGMAHGAYCVGCCWVLMLLLFAGGVMNLLWVAAISVVVLAQKLLPGGETMARVAGVALAGWGVVLIVRAVGVV